MDHRELLQRHLALAERHVIESERRVNRQQMLVAKLERDGLASLKARTLLAEFTRSLGLHRCDVLRAQDGLRQNDDDQSITIRRFLRSTRSEIHIEPPPSPQECRKPAAGGPQPNCSSGAPPADREYLQVPDTAVRQLRRFAQFSEEDRFAIARAITNTRKFRRGDILSADGCHPQAFGLILSGFATRYILYANGKQQTLALFVPGDFVELPSQVDNAVHPIFIRPFSGLNIGLITRHCLDNLQRTSASLAAALNVMQEVGHRITRQWLLNLGCRNGTERLSCFLCEFFTRLQLIGMAQDGSCEFPFAQTDIGAALALTSIHVNRLLMKLRKMGLVTIQNRRLTIHDFPALQKMCSFDPGYLIGTLGNPARPQQPPSRSNAVAPVGSHRGPKLVAEAVGHMASHRF